MPRLYGPPYLFGDTRPTIKSAPASVKYGATLTVETSTPSAITEAILIKCASTTHGDNMSQGVKRFTSVTHTSSGIQVAVPSNKNTLPPGPYMFFVLVNGVPSVAEILMVG